MMTISSRVAATAFASLLLMSSAFAQTATPAPAAPAPAAKAAPAEKKAAPLRRDAEPRMNEAGSAALSAHYILARRLAAPLSGADASLGWGG